MAAEAISPAPAPARAPTLLRIPPFPGARRSDFARAEQAPGPVLEKALDDLIELVRKRRVGGTYWAAQPEVPTSNLLIVRDGPLPSLDSLSAEFGEPLLWSPNKPATERTDIRIVQGPCDPWHMLRGAAAVVCEAGSDVFTIAAILGVPIFTFAGRELSRISDEAAREFARAQLAACGDLLDPFTNEPMTLSAAIELCGHWRSLVDSNRDISGAVGFAFWKQESVAPLLWGGSRQVDFRRRVGDVPEGGSVAVWRAKAAPEALLALENAKVPLIEVEDGFLRSNGLGADCVPPLSITVDRLGAYFDPSQPSELERLLQTAEFDLRLVDRARRLRETIVAAGLGKYERGTQRIDRRSADRTHILVPGQVEDDRSVLTGGSGLNSNLELLRRVRERAPDAYILYKPHPDVLAGHRRGAIASDLSADIADEIVIDLPISALIDMVDEVHVNTSLAGFEALMRGKPVTTYGVPFYAGWGLSEDLGPVPSRRSRQLQLDELVAATLLLYPRYLDPVSGLPCPAEVVVTRLCAQQEPHAGVLVAARRLQGKLKRRIQELLS